MAFGLEEIRDIAGEAIVAWEDGDTEKLHTLWKELTPAERRFYNEETTRIFRRQVQKEKDRQKYMEKPEIKTYHHDPESYRLAGAILASQGY